MKSSKGFTLIELLVVISIIGLLSSVVFASLKTARDKGRIAAGQEFNAHNYHVFAGDSPYLLLNFDEATGGVSPAVDQSGNSYNVVFSGNATRSTDIPGKIGASVSIGTGHLVMNGVTIGQNATVSFWIKSSNYDGKLPISWGASAYIPGYMAIFFSTNMLYLHTFNGAANTYDPSGIAYPDDQWHNIAVTIDSSAQTSKFYLDGKLMGKSYYRNPAMNAGTFYIGALNGVNSFANGLMDEVYVYSQVLAQSDIESIYASGVSRHLAKK